MNTWKLREEILAITHRWYVVAACFLAGALVGWLVSMLWPSPHRATIDLYVGLNAYRSPYDNYVAGVAQQQFRLVDDYKNWQMEQLNQLALTDDFLEETLRRLREEDISWDHTTPQDLRQIFRGVWRNVGVWHLVAEGRNSVSVAQAVDVWSDVVAEWMSASIEHSKNVVALDIQLTKLSEAQTNLELRQQVLRLSCANLLELQDAMRSLPADQPVPARLHWEAHALVARAADWNAGWDATLEAAPAVGSLPGDYLFWLDRVIPLVDQELEALPLQINAIDQQRMETEARYRDETERSRALASTLVIEKSTEAIPQVKPVRSTGLLILVGGTLGFLLWGVWVVSRLGWRHR